MNEQDTITDIIRKIRAEADSIEESARGSLKAGETWDGRPFTESDLESALDLAERKRKEADRLEAAYKREMSKNVSKNEADFGQLGDCAKLREALEDAYSLLCEGIATEVDDEIEHPFHLELAREKIQAALAAPPRNCDVYNNESCRMAYHLHGDGLMTMQAFANWLFAPATERKGETDGK